MSNENWKLGVPLPAPLPCSLYSPDPLDPPGGNIVIGDTGGPYMFSTTFSSGPWNQFVASNLVSNCNTWWNATQTNVFSVPGSLWNFTQWQSTGQDSASTFSDPAIIYPAVSLNCVP